MDEQASTQQIKNALESFCEMFSEYAKEVFGAHRHDRLDGLRHQLQRRETLITKFVLDVLGDSTFVSGSFGRRPTLYRRDLISTALLGGNNELPHNFGSYNGLVMATLNRAIGALEAGLWPREEPTPILVIKDDELRQRCSDLLAAPGCYDRVIRESTTILEDRIRSTCPHEILSVLIPQAADQRGENLINKVFKYDKPVLSISSDELKRKAFHRIMLGAVSYLRNPYHHTIDPSVEWSWAWSTVGFIDRLLADIDICVPGK